MDDLIREVVQLSWREREDVQTYSRILALICGARACGVKFYIYSTNRKERYEKYMSVL